MNIYFILGGQSWWPNIHTIGLRVSAEESEFGNRPTKVLSLAFLAPEDEYCFADVL